MIIRLAIGSFQTYTKNSHSVGEIACKRQLGHIIRWEANMMNCVRKILTMVVVCALAGCITDQPDYHVLKLDRTYNRLIVDPYEWALQQFADGPISGPDVDDYALRVLANGLEQARANLAGDGSQDLLLRSGGASRVWDVLVFTPVKGGYRYMGSFPAGLIVPQIDLMSVLVYEPCGGHSGSIKTYKHDGQKFVCNTREDITVGDGAPDENNRRLDQLFPKDKVITWTKTPQSHLGRYSSTRRRGVETVKMNFAVKELIYFKRSDKI